MENIYCANPFEQFRSKEKKIIQSIKSVLKSNKYILGPQVEKFENKFSKFIGSKYAIGVSNGTDALKISLKAIGIKKGDEVITPSHTAIATISAIVDSGAKPIFVDINKDYYVIDGDKIQKAITKRTKAIIVVHIYGHPVNINKIKSLVKKKNIYIIEDVSQAHGAKIRSKRLGSIGDIGCFSCYPTKNLGGIGDAGVITTNKKYFYNKIRLLREYGWKTRNNSLVHGENSRLDEIQASILNVKLDSLDNDNLKRNKIAQMYNKFLVNKNIKKFPKIKKNCNHVFHLYVLRVKNRDKIINALKKYNIFASVHYPIPAHKQKPYKKFLKSNSNLLNTENISKEILSLPIYPELKIKQVKYIIKVFNKIN